MRYDLARVRSALGLVQRARPLHVSRTARHLYSRAKIPDHRVRPETAEYNALDRHVTLSPFVNSNNEILVFLTKRECKKRFQSGIDTDDVARGTILEGNEV